MKKRRNSFLSRFLDNSRESWRESIEYFESFEKPDPWPMERKVCAAVAVATPAGLLAGLMNGTLERETWTDVGFIIAYLFAAAVSAAAAVKFHSIGIYRNIAYVPAASIFMLSAYIRGSDEIALLVVSIAALISALLHIAWDLFRSRQQNYK